MKPTHPFRRHCLSLGALLVGALLGTPAATPAQAATRALLVGVSGYPAFPEWLRLRGSANDVRLLRDVLLERGVPAASIQTLADGMAGAAPPTHAAILSALESLRQTARPGDTVLVLLAGHGGRQPPDARTPADGVGRDGWVKTFLPLDAGRWTGDPVAVERALPGHVLRRALDAITARGAHLFLLVDSCQSAAVVRGDGGSLRWRSGAGPWSPRVGAGAAAGGGGSAATADPSGSFSAADTLLGESGRSGHSGQSGDSDAQPRDAGATARSDVRIAPGRTAFFYAAQSDQGTPELEAAAAPGAAPAVYGLFTLKVAQVLRHAQQRGLDISYTQLAQQVMNEYVGHPKAGATPLLTGNGLDLPVLGDKPLALRQWPLEGDAPRGQLAVAAGPLEGLAPGSVLALLPSATAADGDALGYAVVIEIAPGNARLQPHAHAGRAAPDAAALASARFARLVSAQAPVALRVALDRSGCALACPLQRAVQALQRTPPNGLALDWVAEPGRAELTLHQAGTRVQVLSAPAGAGDSAALQIDEWTASEDGAELAQSLARRLQAIARVRNLLRLATRLAPADPASAPSMQLVLHAAGAAPAPWPRGAVPRLRSGDRVQITLRNPSALQGWDVTLLSLDATHDIATVFPDGNGESPRLPPASSHEIPGGLYLQANHPGIERLLLIAVPQRRLREAKNFSFLSQPPLGRPREGVDPDLQALFDAIFAPPGTAREGALAAAPPADMIMQAHALDVRP